MSYSLHVAVIGTYPLTHAGTRWHTQEAISMYCTSKYEHSWICMNASKVYPKLRTVWVDRLLVVSSRACGGFAKYGTTQHTTSQQQVYVELMATTPRDEDPSKKQTNTACCLLHAMPLHHAARGCFYGPSKLSIQCLMLLWAVESGPGSESCLWNPRCCGFVCKMHVVIGFYP